MTTNNDLSEKRTTHLKPTVQSGLLSTIQAARYMGMDRRRFDSCRIAMGVEPIMLTDKPSKRDNRMLWDIRDLDEMIARQKRKTGGKS